MKKLYALLLAVLMLLSLTACSPIPLDNIWPTAPAETDPAETTVPEEKEVTVGFGKGNITADWPIGLMGFGNEDTRISGGFKTYIYVMCVAITDTDGETVLIMSIDANSGNFAQHMRPLIEKEFGIPEDHIIVSAVHQYTTPAATDQYISLVKAGTRTAVQQALDDRAPATMLLSTTDTNALTYVRNYIANDGKGTIVSDHYNEDIGSWYGCIKRESTADSEMRIIKFERGEDKKPIVMVNFQAHPNMGADINNTYIHGDWPAIIRETLEEKLDCHAMYLSGAGGNLNSTSRFDEENVSSDWRDHGRRAVIYASNAVQSCVPAYLGDIRVISQTYTYESNHSQDHLYETALTLHNLRKVNFYQAQKEVKKYPEIHSIYHATAIVEQFQSGPTRKLTIGAIAIGDVVFTYHPYEMFDTNGMELRSGTVGNENYPLEDQLWNPYPMTFICTLGNGHLGYVPSKLGYTNGGYCTDVAHLTPGSGELLVGDYLHLLNDLYYTKQPTTERK